MTSFGTQSGDSIFFGIPNFFQTKSVFGNFQIVKGIFSDSNNIFLWHESEDINKKSLLPKFQLIPILRLQVMHDYVHWHCSIDYRVKLSLVYETLCPKLLSFHKEMISAWFLWGNVLIRGELQIYTINSKFENFESALYMKSVSIPLNKNMHVFFRRVPLIYGRAQFTMLWIPLQYAPHQSQLYLFLLST